MVPVTLSIKEKLVMAAPPPREEKYWNRTIETMPREDLLALQWEITQRRLRYVYERSRLYRHRLEQAGVKPDDIKSIEDFKRKVPITTKDDIRADTLQTGDVFGGILTVPLEQVSGFGPSTGTSGEPTQTVFTGSDTDISSEAETRQLWSFGMRPGDLCILWDPGFNPPIFYTIHTAYRKLGLPYISLGLGSMLQERELERWTETMLKLPVKSGWVPYSMLWTYKDYIERYKQFQR